MTLGQIALKYMLNILIGSCKEAVEWLSWPCKVEQVDCFWYRATGIKLLLVAAELLCSGLIIDSEILYLKCCDSVAQGANYSTIILSL